MYLLLILFLWLNSNGHLLLSTWYNFQDWKKLFPSHSSFNHPRGENDLHNQKSEPSPSAVLWFVLFCHLVVLLGSLLWWLLKECTSKFFSNSAESPSHKKMGNYAKIPTRWITFLYFSSNWSWVVRHAVCYLPSWKHTLECICDKLE